MADIKTRNVIKGTIKTVNRSANGIKTMDSKYQKTKDRVEETTNPKESNPQAYAVNKIARYVEDTIEEGVDLGIRAGEKTVRGGLERRRRVGRAQRVLNDTGEKMTQGGSRIGIRQMQIRREQKRMQKKAQLSGVQTVRTLDRQTGTIKMPVPPTAKTMQKTVKNAELPFKQSKIAIKTSQEATRTAVKTTSYTVQTAVTAAQKLYVAGRIAYETTIRLMGRGMQTVIRLLSAFKRGIKTLVAAFTAGTVLMSVMIILVLVLSASTFFSSNAGTGDCTPVSAEVEALAPVIQRYASQYGIGEYVDLIKAIMMQESGGRGNDPMQASESGYNTKYPHSPNAITDPEYSIDCGVQAVKGVLVEAQVKSPVDLERIKLALQGYNYGNGYISWAVAKDGGYSLANAAEFSDMMAARNGWRAYGDKEYVSHVLRYYPYGFYNLGVGSMSIVSSAQKQVGKDGQKYWSWYGFSGRVEWCACFVSWNADQCGYVESGVIPKFSYCPEGADWFKSKNQWQKNGYMPKSGDIIFFDWESDGTTDHVGIVAKVDGGKVYTIEGNSGDKVEENSYALGSSVIYGYGVPRY